MSSRITLHHPWGRDSIHSRALSDKTQRSRQHALGHPCGRRADTGLSPWGPHGTSPCPSLSHSPTRLSQPQQSSTIPFSQPDTSCVQHRQHLQQTQVPEDVSSRSLPALESLQQLLPPFAGTRSSQPICAGSVPPHAGSQAA